MLDEALLEKTEEFLEQIANETRDEDLEFAICSLRELIEQEAYAYSNSQNEKSAYAIQCRLEEIWDLIPSREKKINPDLNEYFDELMDELEEVSDFEAERTTPEEDFEEYEDDDLEEDGEEW